MRKAFGDEIAALAGQDESIILLSGDIGFGVFDRFLDEHPDRFINMGIAEQNMIGVAAGLAKEGMTPLVYTIIPFLLMRPFEQIRVDLAMHKRRVALVGVGEGLSYDKLGPTHHALEDVGLARLIPGLDIIAPYCAEQTRSAIRWWHKNGEGPAYIRLGRDSPSPPSRDSDFKEGVLLRRGDDLTLLTYGSITHEAVKASELLATRELDVGVVAVQVLQPIDATNLIKLIGPSRRLMVVEEHYLVGGLYSALACNPSFASCHLVPLSLPHTFFSRVASREDLIRDAGIDAQSIAAAVERELGSA